MLSVSIVPASACLALWAVGDSIQLKLSPLASSSNDFLQEQQAEEYNDFLLLLP